MNERLARLNERLVQGGLRGYMRGPRGSEDEQEAPWSGTKASEDGRTPGQIAVLSWNAHILSSRCGDGSIWYHDVRVPRHKVVKLLGHTGEGCGLKWRVDGELIVSGANVNVWDGH
jgi:hypothetical protein